MKKANEMTFAQQFLDVFKSLCHTRSSWQVWSDFILMSACSISNATDKAMFEHREEMYLQASKHYTREELDEIAHLFALTALALEENPEQDFLGDIYNEFELYNKHLCQCFTPYSVAKLKAQIMCGDLTERIKAQGSVSVNDCCCGSGILAIAFVNAARAKGVNYQRDMYIVAQDIDFTAAMMCYISLSLLGCSGHVAVGNVITDPIPSRENIWYMPMTVMRKFLP